MNKPLKNFVAIIVVIFIIHGCALHPPVSEEIVFSTDKNKSGFKAAEISSGFSKTFYSSSFEKKALKKYGYGIDSTLNPVWQMGLAPYGFAFHIGENISLGVSPGAIVVGSGIDFTAKLSENNFLTVSGNVYKNFEAIAQHRIYFDRRYGLSLGGFFRSEKQDFGGSTRVKQKDLITSNVAGVRGLYYFNSDIITIRGFTSLGFELEYQTPVFYLGFSYKLPLWGRRKIPPPLYD